MGRLAPELGERSAEGYQSRGSISCHLEREKERGKEEGCVPSETSYPGQPFTEKPVALRWTGPGRAASGAHPRQGAYAQRFPTSARPAPPVVRSAVEPSPARLSGALGSCRVLGGLQEWLPPPHPPVARERGRAGASGERTETRRPLGRWVGSKLLHSRRRQDRYEAGRQPTKCSAQLAPPDTGRERARNLSWAWVPMRLAPTLNPVPPRLQQSINQSPIPASASQSDQQPGLPWGGKWALPPEAKGGGLGEDGVPWATARAEASRRRGPSQEGGAESAAPPTPAGAWDRGPRREADRRQMAHAGGGGRLAWAPGCPRRGLPLLGGGEEHSPRLARPGSLGGRRLRIKPSQEPGGKKREDKRSAVG